MLEIFTSNLFDNKKYEKENENSFYYDEVIKYYSDMFYWLYHKNLYNSSFRLKNYNNYNEFLIAIYEEAKKVCNQILGIKDTGYFRCEFIPYETEETLSYLVLETLLAMKKCEATEKVSLDNFITNYCSDNFVYSNFRKKYIHFKSNPLAALLCADDYITDSDTPEDKKRIQYEFCDFLAPMFGRLINYTDKCPYTKLNDPENLSVSQRTFIMYFEKYLYGKDLGHKPNNLKGKSTLWKQNDNEPQYVFTKEKEDSEIENDYYTETLCYYVLDGIYDIENTLLLSERINELKTEIPKENIRNALCNIILIPNNFIKKYYIDTIFAILKSKEEVLVNPQKIGEPILSIKDFNTTQTNNLECCNSYINFLSNVYYPILSKCFAVFYYNSVKNTSVLENYIYENDLLKHYVTKTKKSIIQLSNLKNRDFDKLLRLYGSIARNIFNTKTLPDIHHMISPDYTDDSFRTEYFKTIIESMINAKVKRYNKYTPLPMYDF